MKKKLITLLLAGVLVLSNTFTVLAEEIPTDASQETPVVLAETTAEYNTKTGAEAVAAVGNEGVVIIDVRAASVYDNGHLQGSISKPVFVVENGSNVITDELKAAFSAYVTGNTSLAGKDIYILCNSGSRGAQTATALLIEAGYSNDNIFTITNGAKDADVQAAFVMENKTVTGAEAVAAIGNENVVIIDVRAKVKYDAGHLKGSVSQPVFVVENGSNVITDELKAAFSAYVTGNTSLAGKDIYILCNSGSRGAQTATTLLREAGYPNANIYTITGGATDPAIQAALTYVSADQVISVLNNNDYVIIDVRAAVRYEAGHLKGSVSLPLFTVDANNKNVAINLEDNTADERETALVENFNNYVTANKAELAGKTIYILCNSGQTGAKNATILLAAQGLAGYTIEGGATNASLQAIFVTDNNGTTTPDNNGTTTPDNNGTVTPDNNNTTTKPNNDKTPVSNDKQPTTSTTPKTGDTVSVMPYVLTMLIALAALVVVARKRVVK